MSETAGEPAFAHLQPVGTDQRPPGLVVPPAPTATSAATALGGCTGQAYMHACGADQRGGSACTAAASGVDHRAENGQELHCTEPRASSKSTLPLNKPQNSTLPSPRGVPPLLLEGPVECICPPWPIAHEPEPGPGPPWTTHTPPHALTPASGRPCRVHSRPRPARGR